MNEFQNKLNSFTEKVAENLYSYKSSINILYTISEFSQTDSIKNFGNFFFKTQQLCIENAILSMTKIFETKKESANINSINNFIQTNIKSLPIQGLVHKNSYKFFQIDH